MENSIESGGTVEDRGDYLTVESLMNGLSAALRSGLLKPSTKIAVYQTERGFDVPKYVRDEFRVSNFGRCAVLRINPQDPPRSKPVDIPASALREVVDGK